MPALSRATAAIEHVLDERVRVLVQVARELDDRDRLGRRSQIGTSAVCDVDERAARLRDRDASASGPPAARHPRRASGGRRDLHR